MLPVAIVITTWNSEAVIGRCLEALRSQRASEIHIIDNGSTDATLQCIKALDLKPYLHHETDNRGFSYSCNEGLTKTQQPFIFYLNDDATLKPGYLETLYHALEQTPHAASAVGKMVYFKMADDTLIRLVSNWGATLCGRSMSVTVHWMKVNTIKDVNSLGPLQPQPCTGVMPFFLLVLGPLMKSFLLITRTLISRGAWVKQATRISTSRVRLLLNTAGGDPMETTRAFVLEHLLTGICLWAKNEDP